MRIIGGTLKGKPLYSPKGTRIRPTSEMVREALFDIIQARIEGARFLDLYGGTGAVGLEAWSRGAGRVVIVERYHIDIVRKNFARLGLTPSPQIHIIRGAAQKAAVALKERGELFDVIFADPPWNDGIEPSTIQLAGDLLNDDGLLIIESNIKTGPPALCANQLPVSTGATPPRRLTFTRSRRYGDTALHFYQK